MLTAHYSKGYGTSRRYKAKKCKGETDKTFYGYEPSPKGLGYCAGRRNVGEVRVGKDGHLWYVATTVSGIKRWKPMPKQQQSKTKYRTKGKKMSRTYRPKKTYMEKYMDFLKNKYTRARKYTRSTLGM